MTRLADELVQLTNQIGRGEIPPYQHHEFYTAGAFDLLLVRVKDAEAFELLSALCECYPAVDPARDCQAAYFNLLAQVARQSQTTELPPALPPMLARHPDLAAELRGWYRLEA